MCSATFVDNPGDMKYKATELAQEAGIPNPKWLISRDFGKLFLPVLEAKLELLQAGNVIQLDFDSIDLMEWSFADEALAVLCIKMLSGRFPNRYLVLEGLSETSAENLEMALRTRPERENKQIRNVILPIVVNREIILIGKLEEHLKLVWCHIAGQKNITARDLATSLSLEINTASTKLKTLFDLRLLKREEIRTEAGKQYLYHSL